MPKKILLLFTQASIRDHKADPEKLTSLLRHEAKDKLTVTWATFEDLTYNLSPQQAEIRVSSTDTSLLDFDVVYFRRWGEKPDHAMACALFLNQHGKHFIDPEINRPGSMSKLTQYMRFWQHDLPFPRTLLGNFNWVQTVLKDKTTGWQFPLIAKATSGSRGENNHLVHNLTELKELHDNQDDIEYIIQEFIPNQSDYRVLVMDSQVKLVILRTRANNTHKNNTSLGGDAQLMPHDSLSDDVRQIAVQAALAMKREIAGVDIVMSDVDQQYYLLEVNRAPQIEDSSFEVAKAKMLVEYLQNC